MQSENLPESQLPSQTEDSRPGSTEANRLETERLRLEHRRLLVDLGKWIAVAVGAIVSFMVIDRGNLELEKFRVRSEHQRELLKAYLDATDAPEPDVWLRKLRVLRSFAQDDQTQRWADDEVRHIEEFAAQAALYRETVRIASQLVEPSQLSDPSRREARIRFNQLYWADLPHARESPSVIAAMIEFRKALQTAEAAPEQTEHWEALNIQLITLSEALRDSMPRPGR